MTTKSMDIQKLKEQNRFFFNILNHTGNICHYYICTLSASREDSIKLYNAQYIKMMISYGCYSLGSFSETLEGLPTLKKKIMFLSMSVLYWPHVSVSIHLWKIMVTIFGNYL